MGKSNVIRDKSLLQVFDKMGKAFRKLHREGYVLPPVAFCGGASRFKDDKRWVVPTEYQEMFRKGIKRDLFFMTAPVSEGILVYQMDTTVFLSAYTTRFPAYYVRILYSGEVNALFIEGYSSVLTGDMPEETIEIYLSGKSVSGHPFYLSNFDEKTLLTQKGLFNFLFYYLFAEFKRKNFKSSKFHIFTQEGFWDEVKSLQKDLKKASSKKPKNPEDYFGFYNPEGVLGFNLYARAFEYFFSLAMQVLPY